MDVSVDKLKALALELERQANQIYPNKFSLADDVQSLVNQSESIALRRSATAIWKLINEPFNKPKGERPTK